MIDWASLQIEMIKERVSELQDRSMEIIQYEEYRETMFKNEQSLREFS